MLRNFDQRNSRKKPMKTSTSKTTGFVRSFYLPFPLGHNMELERGFAVYPYIRH